VPTHYLTIEPDLKFKLIALVTVMRGYRLCWSINQVFHFDFVKQADLVIENPRKKQRSSHDHFLHKDNLNLCTFSVVANGSQSYWILPEIKQVSYLIKISGEWHPTTIGDMIEKLNKIPNIQTAFELDIDNLKSKDNLLLF